MRAPSDSSSAGQHHQSPASPLMFLDIDDVLCMSSPYGGFAAIAAVNGQHVNPEAVYRELFAVGAVKALKRVHDEMDECIRYVISSTWRESFSREQLELVFRRSGLGFVADNLVGGKAWRTPVKFRLHQRVDEIAQWLDQHHRGEPFVIVDDTHSGASLRSALKVRMNAVPHPFAGRVVLCQENVGLTDAHVPTIVAALRREVVRPAGLESEPMADGEQP